MTQIDHVFLFPHDLAGVKTLLEAKGLAPSFRRAHPGQGTANVCYCFENTYLELLWVDDATAQQHPGVARTGLIQRGTGGASACPIGIAWRDAQDAALDAETWDYHAPFLPAGMSIAVATESDDPTHPFVFRSPGTSAPSEWTDGRAGRLQRAAGLGAVERIVLGCPSGFRPGLALTLLAQDTILCTKDAPRWSLTFEITRTSGAKPLRLTVS
ncbi:VOC family protein [Psychromarinibacter halotolerans]|uniref:VOC family protein n=1 Tax=Psychromarinibacter halotolerans TaxID=1775175 RepID=A0ABV7GWS4_9RHOB|nr:VOC family protein [Psychromarinibacter halotolerans]MDF0597673.1 VOC family protein [Psychromarinibacter halotolerans]